MYKPKKDYNYPLKTQIYNSRKKNSTATSLNTNINTNVNKVLDNIAIITNGQKNNNVRKIAKTPMVL